MLFDYKTAGIEIAVETAVGGSELEDTVVGIGDAAGIVFHVTVAPYHLLALGIGQHLHCTAQHNALKALGVAEVDAGLGIRLVMGYA